MPFSIAVAVEGAKTNQDGRALLGVASTFLRRAFSAVPNLPAYEGVRDNANELLTRSNNYAQKIYATLSDDGTPLAAAQRKQVSVALDNAHGDMLLVAEVDHELEWDFLHALADIIPAGIAAVVGAVGAVAFEHWALTIGIVVLGAVFVLYVLPRLPKLLGQFRAVGAA